jgi:hypothetical protein
MSELQSAHSQSPTGSSALDPTLPRMHGGPGQLIRANEARSQPQIGSGLTLLRHPVNRTAAAWSLVVVVGVIPSDLSLKNMITL